MTTRLQDANIIVIPRVSGHVLDPSETPEYNPAVPTKGVTAKTIFDCTVPFAHRDMFARAQFRDVDPQPYAPGLHLQYPVDDGASQNGPARTTGSATIEHGSQH
jgi:gallate decarboxylase subunit C